MNDNPNITERKQIKYKETDMRSAVYFKRYLKWCFALAWIMQIYAGLQYLQGNGLSYTFMLAISMFAPMVAVGAAGGRLRGMGWKLHVERYFLSFLQAWFLPAILGVIGAALYFLIFPDRLDLSCGYIAAALGDEMVAEFASMGISQQEYALMSLMEALTLAPFINMLFAVGEEAGWRGVMYPVLKDRFGVMKGRIIGGTIWGIWHWPIMILAGYEYGSTYFGAPVLGPLLFCLICIALGTFADELYERTDCIWIPALFHGAVNAFAGVPILYLNTAYADQLILGPLMIGLIAGLPLLIGQDLFCIEAEIPH